MAAHVFRAGLWEREGFTTTNPHWYGGHHVPAYSLLFPPLTGALGPRLPGVLAAVAATWLVAGLARRHAPSPRAATAGTWLFAAGALANVVVGRMPFTVGVALAAAAWWCADRCRPGWAAAASLACVWTSPVAGLFLALTAVAALARGPDGIRAAAVLALPVALGGGALAALFPEGGTEAFVATAFWPQLAVCAAALTLLDARLRPAAAAYLVLLAAAFALPNPVGQNAARLGVLVGPALLVLAPRAGAPRAALLAAGLSLVYLQWLPAVRAVAEAQGDPSVRAGFHAELVETVAGRLEPGERVEVVFTRNHWEAAHVAPAAPLARGWQRQLDRRVNGLFYAEAPLTAARYRAWLRRMDVRFVALPAVPLDHSARAEAALLRTPPGYLTPVRDSGRWKIWEVRG